TTCCHTKGRSVIGIEFSRSLEVRQRLDVTFSGPLMNARQATQIVVVCIQALCWFVLGPFNLGLFLFGRDFTHYACRHLIMQIENIYQFSFKTVCPDMGPSRNIDELSRDTHSVASLAHTAFKHIAYA